MVEKVRKRSERREQIIKAAADLFSRKGFARTKISDVAALAGIGKGTVYEYFESKEDLYFEVFQWFTKQMGEGAMVSVSALGGPASSRLMALSEALIGSWDSIREMFSLFFEFWAASASSKLHEKFKEAFRTSYGEFRAIVSELIRDGMERNEFRKDIDPASVAAALVGTWDCLFLQAWFDDEFDLKKTARNFLSVVIEGMSVET